MTWCLTPSNLAPCLVVVFDASSTGTLRLNGTGVTISGLSTDPTTPGTPVVESANSMAANGG